MTKSNPTATQIRPMTVDELKHVAVEVKDMSVDALNNLVSEDGDPQVNQILLDELHGRALAEASIAQWAEIERNTPPRLQYAVHGAIGEANSEARFRGQDENAAHSAYWCATAVKAYREIAGAR